MLSLLVLAAPSLAATLTVDPTGTGAYSTISAAISDSTDGDIITVAAGTYAECLDSDGKSLTIEGTSGSGATTLNPSGACSNAVTIDGGETLTMTGFTVLNASNRAFLVSGSALELTDISVESTGSTGLSGPAVHADGAFVSIDESAFTNNVGYYGGALYLTGTSDLTVEDSDFSGNYAYYGGALFSAGGSNQVEISDSSLISNYTYYNGGAIYLGMSDELTSTGNEYFGNWGYYTHGGAIYLFTDATLESNADDFESNYAYYASNGYAGGAIYAYSQNEISIESGMFTGNRNHYGGAIHFRQGGSLAIDASGFSTHQAYQGGAIHLAGASTYPLDLDITDSTFDSNAASHSGGHLFNTTFITAEIDGTEFIDGSAGSQRGGDIYHYYYGGLTVTDSTFTGSEAEREGGSLYLHQASTAPCPSSTPSSRTRPLFAPRAARSTRTTTPISTSPAVRSRRARPTVAAAASCPTTTRASPSPGPRSRTRHRTPATAAPSTSTRTRALATT